MITFNDWLVREGHVRDIESIEFELSAGEVEELYMLYSEDYPQ